MTQFNSDQEVHIADKVKSRTDGAPSGNLMLVRTKLQGECLENC